VSLIFTIQVFDIEAATTEETRQIFESVRSAGLEVAGVVSRHSGGNLKTALPSEGYKNGMGELRGVSGKLPKAIDEPGTSTR